MLQNLLCRCSEADNFALDAFAFSFCTFDLVDVGDGDRCIDENLNLCLSEVLGELWCV